MANKSLGRGLSTFLNAEFEATDTNENIVKVRLDSIKANPYQPRQVFDDEQLQSLAASIKRKAETSLLVWAISTQTSHCRGHRLDPWTQIPRALYVA